MKRKLSGMGGAAVLLLAIGLVLAGCMTVPQKAQKFYERGEYTKAIELDPNFADAYAKRAEFYLRNKKPNEALADCNKAIELDPQNALAYVVRGKIYLEQGGSVSEDEMDNLLGSVGSLFGLSIPKKGVAEYTGMIEKYDQALSDFNRYVEVGGDKSEGEGLIRETQKRKNEVEAEIAKIKAKEAASKYDPAKFVFFPKNFNPADYTKADLFTVKAASEKLKMVDTEQRVVNIFNVETYTYTPTISRVSDVVFVSQDGTDITFKTADNAVSQPMKIDSRAGLTAGQKVRIYYKAARIWTDWHVDAIERL